MNNNGESAASKPQLLTVEPDQTGERLDRFLAQQAGLTRSRAQTLLDQGQCLLDGQPAPPGKTKLAAGQVVSFCDPGTAARLQPEQGDLQVLYEDDCLAVIAKPSNLTVHPCPSCPEKTLANRLLSRFPQLALLEGERPGIVHRLDKDTSGLLLVALTEACRLSLAADFAERRVEKHYLALTRGVPPEQGRCEQPLGRHPTHKTKMAVLRERDGGRPALSVWKRLYADPQARFALLDVDLHTGRTHQIRVHLAHSGFPLWGDKVYGPGGPDPAPRQMLHAWKLAFNHPQSNERLSFCLPPPPDFLDTACKLSRNLLPVILTGAPGSGKSLAAQYLAANGLRVWSADQAVNELYQPEQDGWQMLDRFFHGRFCGPGQAVDKARLQQAMAENQDLRRELEMLIHPLVFARMFDFFGRAEQDGEQLAVAEVPLWFENEVNLAENLATNLPVDLEQAVVVWLDAPEPVRFARLHERGWDQQRIAATEAWQWPPAKKAAKADLLLDNSGSMMQFETKMRQLKTQLLELALQRNAATSTILEQTWIC